MSNSDIALIASVDFSKADREVDAFVTRSKRKMSEIQAAANKPGGSQAGVRNAGTGGRVGNTNSYAADAAESRAAAQRYQRELALERVKTHMEQERRQNQLRAFNDARRLAEYENRQFDRKAALRRQAEAQNARYDSSARARLIQQAQIENRQFDRRSFLRKQAEAENARFDSTARARLIQQAQIENRQFDRKATLRRQAEAENARYDSNARARLIQQAQVENRHFDRRATMRRQAEAENARFDSTARARLVRLAEIENKHYDRMSQLRRRAEADNARFDAGRQNSSVSVTRATGSASNTALGVQNRIGRQLGENPALQAELTNRLNTALGAYTNTVRTYGTRSQQAAEATVRWNRELQNVRSSIAQNGGLLRTLNRNSEGLRGSIASLGGSMGGLGRIALNTQVALSALTAAFGMREIVNSIVNFERFSNTLRSVSGNAAAFQENMRYLFADGERVGFSVAEVGNSFARLSVAMQGAGFNTENTRAAFTNLTEASRNFGLTSADTMGIVRALEQSMSKGKFMAEEVRLQMGDRLPIAMAALQAAMNKVDGGVVDVNKRFEEGTIDVQRYGLEFVRQIQLMSGGSEALSRTQNSVAAAFGRLSNAFTLFVQELDKAGFGQAVISITEQLSKIMGMAADSGALSVFGSVVLTLANNFTLLATAALAVGAALVAGKIVATFAAIAAIATPLGAALTGIGVAIGALGLAFTKNATASEDYARSIRQTAVTTGRATTEVTSQVSDATRALDVSVAASTQSAESNFQKLVRSLQQTGASLEDATKRALESTQKAVDAQIALTRLSLQAAQRDLQGFINATTNANRMDSQLDANIRDQSGAYGGPSAAYLEAAGSFRTLIGALREGSQPIEVISGRFRDLQTQVETSLTAATQANDPLKDQLTSINTLIGFMLESFGKLDAAQLTRLREQVQNVTRDLAAQTGQANILSATIASLGQPLQGGDGPAGNNVGSTVRIRPVAFESVQTNRGRTAERNLRNNLTQAGAIGQASQGTTTTLGIAPNLQQMLAFVRTTPQASAVLQQYNKDLQESEGSAGRLSNALGELMQDMRRQTEAAGLDEGAAKAHADALNRVRDAAQNARNAIATAAQEAEAEALVTRRLTAERNQAIKVMDRTSAGNLAIAAAYRQSTAAGAEAEIMVEARTKALETARSTDANYTDVVNELAAALRRSASAEAAAAASRQIANDNDEIAVLRLEQSLLSTNVGLREQEVAALRARQQFRNAPADVRDAAEQSARQLVAVRQENQQLENSWNELSRVGEQAFERIGSAITEAFAQGGIKAINFGNIAKAVFSEVIQAGLRMAVINPVLNSVFGGDRGTLGGVMSAVSTGGGGGSATGGAVGGLFSTFFGGGSNNSGGNSGSSRVSMGRAPGVGRSPNTGPASSGSLPRMGGGLFDSGASIYTPGYSFGSGMVGSFDRFAGTGIASFLDKPIWTSSAAPTNVGAFAEGTMAGTGSTAAGSLSIGQAAMGGLSIAGGLYGIYSGLQQGGAKGYTNAFGGAAGVVGGGAGIMSAMGIGGAAMAGIATVAPYVAIAAAIVATMLPEQKPSNREQNVSYNTITGQTGTDGQTGKKFSAQNAEASKALGDNILELGKMIGAASGLPGQLNTNFKVGYGDRDGVYFQDGSGNKNTYDRDDADLVNKLMNAATIAFLQAASDQTSDQGVKQVIGQTGRVGADATLQNLTWYRDVYTVMSKAADDTSAFQNSLKEIADRFDLVRAKARDLGLSEAGLVEQRQKAIDAAIAQRDTTVAVMKADIEENLLRAKGLDAQAAINQTQREANASIESLKDSLKALGLTAWETQPYVDLLTESFVLQQRAANEALARQQVDLVRGLDSREQGAYASLYGSAPAAQAVNLESFDRAAGREIEDLEKQMKSLGFVTADVAGRVAQLVSIQKVERKVLEQQFNDQKAAVAQSLSDRLFAVANDNSTQAGALAALERDHARERVEAARQGLADMLELEKVQAAERAKIASDFAKQQVEAIRQVGGSIRQYLDSLLTSNAGGTSPQEQFAAAQSIFSRDMTLAQGGDMDALGRVTQSADTLLTASGDMFASGPQFQAMRDMIISSLESLPAVKSYDQLIYEELLRLGGSIDVEVAMAAEIRLKAEVNAALASIDTSAASIAAKIAAQTALNSIVGVVSQITVPGAVTGVALTTATEALSKVIGAVQSITLSATTTNVVRIRANEALSNIIGAVSLISMAPDVPAAVKVRANLALATITGNIQSISLAATVTDDVKTDAIVRLSTITAAVSTITLAPTVTETVKLAATAALSTISGAVTSIALASSVTNTVRLNANEALSALVGAVTLISMDPAVSALARERATLALSTIAGNVETITLSAAVSDAIKNDAITRLSTITAAISTITMAPSVTETVKISATAALATISGAVSSIAVASSVTNEARVTANTALSKLVGTVTLISMDPTVPGTVKDRALAVLSNLTGVVTSIALSTTLLNEQRDKANAVFATIVGAVGAITVSETATEAARIYMLDSLGSITTSVQTIVDANIAAAAKTQLLTDFSRIMSVLGVVTNIAGIPEEQRRVIFGATDAITKIMTIAATGGILTDTQKLILQTEAGNFTRALSSVLSGTTTLTADQRAMLEAGSGTVNRVLKQQIETTETVAISRSIDDKLSGLLSSINYSVTSQLAYLHNLGDVRTYLFHLREMARGQQGGLRVTTLNASGGVNGAFQNAGGAPINWARMDNFGGLETGGWVGNGIWNQDSVLAAYAGGGQIALAGGEYVVNAESAARYANELTSMNSGTFNSDGGDNGILIAEVRALREEMAALREAAERTANASETTAETNEKMAKDTSNRPTAIRAGTRRS